MELKWNTLKRPQKQHSDSKIYGTVLRCTLLEKLVFVVREKEGDRKMHNCFKMIQSLDYSATCNVLVKVIKCQIIWEVSRR